MVGELETAVRGQMIAAGVLERAKLGPERIRGAEDS